MKRMGNLFDQIPSWENLRCAVAKALRGKRSKANARQFVSRLDENLLRLQRKFMSGELEVGRFHQFVIYDPKQRLITAPCFEERVVHHAIMNVCEVGFERYLIHDSYACRRGKGREACLRRAGRFSHRHPWFLKLDVRKYFDSIDHSILLELLASRFKDGRLLALFERIVRSYSVAPGKGLPIGSLTSQHGANLYLGTLDHFIKEQLRAPGYVRYMDDMALWGPSRDCMRCWLSQVDDFLRNRLKLHLKIPQLNRTRHGINLLGCRVFPTHVILNRRSRRRFRRKLGSLEFACVEGRISEAELQQRAQALLAFTMGADVKSWRFRQTVVNHGR